MNIKRTVTKSSRFPKILSYFITENRTCVSPENYGFDVYAVNIRELYKGPEIIGSVRFVSGTSWFFKWKTKRKYKLYL